jgi:phenylpropionate dioxygenase-like ring-hydroxylating dioxygenase large terminal subunit
MPFVRTVWFVKAAMSGESLHAVDLTPSVPAAMAAAMSLTSVAVYERTVRASLERVWENVLDWEHLPWLHRATFGHIRLLDGSRDGWRAEASLRSGGSPFVIDVALDRARLRYHARTTEGPGAGTDIVTALAPVAEHETAIRVEFLVPDVVGAQRDVVGAAYVRLYTQLWDEDEAMMMRRQALLDGRLAETIREVEIAGARVRFGTVCPHFGGPLDGAPVEDDCVTCPWHGYRFDLRTGRTSRSPDLQLSCGAR